MHALVLSDIHGAVETMDLILEAHPEAEILFAAGDLTNFGAAAAAAEVIDSLDRWVASAATSRRRAFLVPGNCDPFPARHVFRKSGYNIGGECREFAAGIVCGGEDLPEPLSVPRGLSVVLTHVPPADSGGDLKAGRHVGSREYASLLERYRPNLWICGHIHESRCVALSGPTLVINPGPAALGYYALLSFEPDPRGWFVAGARLASLERRPGPRDHRPVGL